MQAARRNLVDTKLKKERGPGTSKLKARSYLLEDFAALHAMDQICFPQGVAYPEYELRFFLTARDAIVRIALLDDAIVGFVIAHLYRGRPTFQARIITIDVAPEKRHTGIGSFLMDECEQELRRNQISCVRLEVSVANTSAQGFYRKYGYQVVGTLPAYYATGEDALAMQKQL